MERNPPAPSTPATRRNPGVGRPATLPRPMAGGRVLRYSQSHDHPMSPREIALVQESFRKVMPIADQAAALFYARLFELDPSLRALFHGSMAEQGRKLMQMLGFAVSGLTRVNELVPHVRQLGLRHAGYQVRESHYETVGEALLWTLARGLGAGFTAEHQAAWAKVYWLLAETMKTGARDGLAQIQRSVA